MVQASKLEVVEQYVVYICQKCASACLSVGNATVVCFNPADMRMGALGSILSDSHL